MSDKMEQCSFCSKLNADVLVLVAGPNDLFICDECVEACRDIVGLHRCKRPVPIRSDTTEKPHEA